MSYINHNAAINELKKLVEQRVAYMSESFNAEQKQALELFKQRLYLEEIVEECTAFSHRINWEDYHPSLGIARSAEDLIEIFKLRSDVFIDTKLDHEFPDPIKGLNFDDYDKHSAILFYKNEGVCTGTCRLIFDKKGVILPSEEKCSFNEIRKDYKQIGELSRNVIRHKNQGLNMEFKYMMGGIYHLFMQNDIDLTIFSTMRDYYKLFNKFGGTQIIDDVEVYGELDIPSLIVTWNPQEVSKFFKRTILSEK